MISLFCLRVLPALSWGLDLLHTIPPRVDEPELPDRLAEGSKNPRAETARPLEARSWKACDIISVTFCRPEKVIRPVQTPGQVNRSNLLLGGRQNHIAKGWPFSDERTICGQLCQQANTSDPGSACGPVPGSVGRYRPSPKRAPSFSRSRV